MRYTLTFFLALLFLNAFAERKNYDFSFSVFRASRVQFAGAEIRMQHAEQLQSKFPGFLLHTDRLSGEVNDIYGYAMQVPGQTLTEKSVNCMNHLLNGAGINASEWQLYRQQTTSRAKYTDYQRYIDGHKVIFSRLGFRYSIEGDITRIIIRNYGTPGAAKNPVLSKNNILSSGIATEDIHDIHIISETVADDWVWFPLPSKNKYILQPAWQVHINATIAGSHPAVFTCYIDAVTGQLLYRTNEVKEIFEVTVKGNVYTNTPLTPATLEPLEHLMVIESGNIHFTDSTGLLSLPSFTSVTGNYSLSGKWAVVIDNNISGTPFTNQVLSGTGNNLTFPSDAKMINAYYHTNRIHEYMKQYMPSFNGLDVTMQARVDVPNNTCNAFYNGNINFYIAGSGCGSWAEIGDIVYHEYGHAINHMYYFSQTPAPMGNGAMNEAYADVWAMSANGDGVVGEGVYQVNGGGFIRRYDKLAKVYPDDIVGEVHQDGEVLAGAWWDVAVNRNSVDSMTRLFVATYDDFIDGPDGTEGQVYHDILVSALLHDDNDQNLQTGTPHFEAIASAFARHGIYLYGDALFAHTEIANPAIPGEAVAVSAYLNVTGINTLTELKLVYKERGTGIWKTGKLTGGSSGTFTFQYPGNVQGTIVDYYFKARTISALPHGIFPVNYNPDAISTLTTIPYQFGIGLISMDSNNFEAQTNGWTVGYVAGDDATTGIWVHDIAIGSFLHNGTISQASGDHTSGVGKCLVTENAANTIVDVGTADVDNGITTVLSPVYNVTNFFDPIIEYYRWYANSRGGNAGNDAWHVAIRDTTTNDWITIDSTYQADYHWRRRIFKVNNFIANPQYVQLRFTAADVLTNDAQNNGQSVVEAGIDDFKLYDRKPVGIEELHELHASVYPNPADKTVQVQLASAYNGAMKLYNINGQLLTEIPIHQNSLNYTIGTSKLPAGQYHLVIESGKRMQIFKLFVQH